MRSISRILKHGWLIKHKVQLNSTTWKCNINMNEIGRTSGGSRVCHMGPLHILKDLSAEHRHPTRLLQPLPIPKWKWEVVTMDFIIGFPRIGKQHDSIMMVVDKLMKAAHFIPLKTTHKEDNIVDIFMMEIARLHDIPKTIVSDRDPKFTSKFWKGLFKGFRMNLNFNIAYHPESDGKTKRVNQVIEDMLRMYVMDKPSKWEDYLHLVELSYNNGYQA
jgi:hypothetical protein